jgi:hypothetical protein
MYKLIQIKQREKQVAPEALATGVVHFRFWKDKSLYVLQLALLVDV